MKRLLQHAPFAWGILLLVVTLSLLPFLLLDKPGMKFELLAPFLGLPIISIAAAAWLHARAGSIIAWLLVVSAFFLISLHTNGPARMIQVDGNTLFSVALGFLITALALGQLRSVGQKLAMAYREATIAHENLASAHAIIQKQALTDALTGLPNHRAVIDQLDKEVERARRYARSFSLLFFDADRFKHVNDTYGHATGDTVLQYISEQAGSVLRGGDTLGRFGGEEFVLLLPEAEASEAASVAERIRASVASGSVAAPGSEGGISMTVSIGISTYPIDADSQQELLSQADEAMYISKRMGRNQVRTAEEARQMSADVELMALLQQKGQDEVAEREGITLEHIRETTTAKMISSLMALLERRDQGLSQHASAVSELARTIAQAMELEPAQVARIGMAGLLHDIGKVAIPDVLLQKADQLTIQERALLHEHAELGAQILEANLFLSDLTPAVRHHHERWDGQGYPNQLAGENIPLAARIIAVAEVYDAIQRGHVYQSSRSSEEARAELLRRAGTQFDPAVVQALLVGLAHQQEQEQAMQAVG